MPQPTKTEQESWIPKVSRKSIQELAKRIKPVIRMARIRTTIKEGADGSITITNRKHPRGKMQATWDERGELHYIKPVDPFNIAYTWDPKPRAKATGLKPLCDIKTFHTYGYQGFFKPSIAEVLAQIPAKHLNKVVAFEIVESPDTTDDLNREWRATNAGYHVATTRLYVRE